MTRTPEESLIVPLAFVSDPANFFDGDWVESKDQDPSGEIRLLQLADIGVGRFLDKSDRHINQETFERLACREIHPRDVLIARMPDPIARACVLPEGLGRTITVVDVAVLRANQDRLVPEYLAYVLNSERFRSLIESLQGGTTRQRISRSRLGQQPIPFPDLETQQRIANYLDRETGEIDAMISTLEKLEMMLNERRDSTITSSVSGAQIDNQSETGNRWFPYLPKGWGISSVDLVCEKITDGSHVSPETQDGVYDFVSTRDVKGGVIDFEGSLKTSVSSYESLVRSGCRPSDGDILYSKDGTIGEMALVHGTHDFVVASSLIIVTPDKGKIDPNFFSYALSSSPAKDAAFSYSRGAGLPRLSIINFSRGIEIPLPPLRFQRLIADHLDEVTGKIGAMLAKVTELKSLLTERRAALITDVVTGQKDIV